MKQKIIEILKSEKYNICLSETDINDIAYKIEIAFKEPDFICPNCNEKCEPIIIGKMCNRCFCDI